MDGNIEVGELLRFLSTWKTHTQVEEKFKTNRMIVTRMLRWCVKANLITRMEIEKEEAKKYISVVRGKCLYIYKSKPGVSRDG